MASEVVMPKMGYDMTEGTIVNWKVKEGDSIKKGDILAEIETGKVNIEIEAFESGVLAKILAQPGQTLAVGTPIALLGQPGEKVEAPSDGQTPAPPKSAERPTIPTETRSGIAPPTPVSDSVQGESAGSQPAKLATGPTTTAEPTGQARDALRAQGEGGPPAPEEGEAPVGGIKASPVARRLADEAGIDLRQVKGSGPSGRIVKLDIEDYLAQRKAAPAPAAAAPAAPAAPAPQVTAAAPAPAAPAPAPTPAPVGAQPEATPFSRMRGVIAQRLQQSVQTAPHFYVTVPIDMTDAMAFREQVNAALASENIKVTVNDLVLKAVTNALLRHPEINVTVTDKGITRHPEVNLGIAVPVEEGLLVPVLRNAGQKSISQIAQETKGLIERVRSNKLKPDDMGGGTFSVSNMGPFGVEQFTAIINPPEAAILAVGSALPEPVVRDGQVVVRTMMRVTMSSDHRVIDGAMAARFLQTLKAQLENPSRIVL